MTCCAEDIQFMGIPCRFVGSEGLETRSWVQVTASIEAKRHALYQGVGPVLTALTVEPAQRPQEEVCTF